MGLLQKFMMLATADGFSVRAPKIADSDIQ